MTRYHPRAALLVVDVQNDFADPAGSLYVRGGEEIVEPLNEEIRRALESGAFVVYTQDWHPASTPHFRKDGGIWPVHCVGGTWGAAFHPELSVIGPIVRKGTGGEDGYSGFSTLHPGTGKRSDTKLARLLEQHGTGRVVIVGLALDYCVKETALDAVANGFETEVDLDLTRAVELEPGDGERAVTQLRAEGVECRKRQP